MDETFGAAYRDYTRRVRTMAVKDCFGATPACRFQDCLDAECSHRLNTSSILPHMRCRLFGLVCLLLFWGAGSLAIRAQAPTAKISGTVVDPAGHVLPGVAVTLETVAAPPRYRRSGYERRRLDDSPATPDGLRSTPCLPAPTWSSPNYQGTREASISPSWCSTVSRSTYGSHWPRPPCPRSSMWSPRQVLASRSSRMRFREDFLRVFQLPTDRFQEALPLLPSVIRDPRGRLSFNGTRPSQSTLLVNGTNATDPVTGQFAVELPLSVIETVEVHSIPYSAEFGQVSGAVANVRTIAGDDHWDVDIGSVIPKPRFRNGTLMGINSATPRVKVSGPFRRGSAWFSQAFSYRFGRSRVKEEIPGDGRRDRRGVRRVYPDRRQGSVTATPSPARCRSFPQMSKASGSTRSTRRSPLPIRKSAGGTLPSPTNWRRVQTRSGRLSSRCEGSMWPFGPRARDPHSSRRTGCAITISTRSIGRAASWSWVQPAFRAGVGAPRSISSRSAASCSPRRSTASTAAAPLTCGARTGGSSSGSRLAGQASWDASDVITSGYVQDHWQVNPRLALDLGLRYDYDAMLGASHLSAAYRVFAEARCGRADAHQGRVGDLLRPGPAPSRCLRPVSTAH